MLEEQILPFFIKFAYQPWVVYVSMVGIMYASSFGLPIPEEVALVSTGLVCYIGMNNPPPHPGATPINVYIAAIVAFLSVFSSDLIIYALGRFYGKKVLNLRFMRPYQNKMTKIMVWTQKYGHWAASIFRFTPGLRFPGHFSCGMMGLPLWKFALVDGTAALLSVPTQIFLIAYYGEKIIHTIKEFNMVVGAIAIVGGIIYIIHLIRKRKMEKRRKERELAREKERALQRDREKLSTVAD